MKPVPLLLALVGCAGADTTPTGAPAGGDLQAIMAARGLSEKDVLAAAKTYTPSGKHDEYVIFASGAVCCALTCVVITGAPTTIAVSVVSPHFVLTARENGPAADVAWYA